MSIAQSLRRARKRSGKSLRSVAARSGIAFSNLSAIENGRRDPTASTVDKFAGALGIDWVPFVTQGRTPAGRASEEITDAEAHGNFARAYRRFLQLANDLGSADPVTRVLLSAEEPAGSASRWLDAIAALVELRLREASAPIPQWVVDRAGDPDNVWEPQRSARGHLLSADRTRVPPEFLRRGIAIEIGELASA